jgi:transglutaminase-like putative cysteine protease
VIYEVSHRTTYSYAQPVSISHHLLHLTPRDSALQTCLDSAIEITPAPSVREPDRDYFGNPTTFVTIQQSHAELVVHALSMIEVAAPPPPDPAGGMAWEAVRARLAAAGAGTGAAEAPDALEALEYGFASPYVPLAPELAAYAAQSFPPGRPCLEAALELTRRIHRDFAYDPRATTVGTGVQEAFRLRRGVCQDFAHIAIACLRGLGLPARYVSGYLLTRPPEGRERLVGADASHAWLSLWLPEGGWVDLDPTNDMIPGEEHITVAWGRDYGDVSPISGVMFGGGEHQVSVGVDVLAIR